MKLIKKILFGESVRGEQLTPIKFYTVDYPRTEEFEWYKQFNVSARAQHIQY